MQTDLYLWSTVEGANLITVNEYEGIFEIPQLPTLADQVFGRRQWQELTELHERLTRIDRLATARIPYESFEPTKLDPNTERLGIYAFGWVTYNRTAKKATLYLGPISACPFFEVSPGTILLLPRDWTVRVTEHLDPNSASKKIIQQRVSTKNAGAYAFV